MRRTSVRRRRPGPLPRVKAIYYGYTSAVTEGMRLAKVRYPGEPDRKLPTRLDLRKHSPSGFSWGFEGSGCAQLALAILADFLGDDAQAEQIYQSFKSEVIARIPQEIGHWELTGEQIMSTESYKMLIVSGVIDS